MINGFEINGTEINGGETIETFRVSTGNMPALTAEIIFRETEPTGVNNGELPTFTADIYFGGQVNGELPAFTSTITMTVTPLFRVDGDLPRFTLDSTMSVSSTVAVNGSLPVFEASIFGGAIVAGDLPVFTCSASLVVDSLLRVNGELPAFTLSSTLTSSLILSVDGELPAFTSLSGTVQGSLPVFLSTITLTATVARVLQSYAMNVKTGAMTAYTNYPFEFLVRFQGKNYGFNSSGCFLLEGADDNGTDISGYFDIPEMDYDASNEKRVDSVYIGSNADGRLVVTGTVDNDRSAIVATAFTGRNRRAKMPKGLKGRYWGFRVANTNGGPMSVDSIDILPEITRRKVK